MEQYVALVQVDGNTLWIANPTDNNPRIFDDVQIAETAAKVMSNVYKIVTLEEFKKMTNGG